MLYFGKDSTLIPLMEIATSSSSSSSSFLKSEPHFINDVFINFREEEISRKFIWHLNNVLLQAQVKTFVDEKNLQERMKLEEHMGAIACSKIAIIVFSKTYTESALCLRELEKIIECHETFGQIVMPVFYQVNPFDVCTKCDFGKALEEAAEESYSEEQLKHVLSRWSHALTKAAVITGWDVKDFRHDGELVEVIVSRIQTLLDYKDLFITKFPVGLESRVEKVIGCIENHSNKACMIGIWGMGGSGKTTVAKAIYNRIYRTFIGKSFIENIREVYDGVSRSNIHLQEHLLYDVLKSKLQLESISLGRTMIENELSRKRLLIVLDDVNEFDQLDSLFGKEQWFGQGSVIIITTRDVRHLRRNNVDYVYKTEEMNETESLELFSWHAFGEEKPIEDFNDVARNVVGYCGGLPLALEVLGSYLSERTKKEWKSVFSKLKIIPNTKVQEKLRISFDDLRDEVEQEIFLDICCFFIGKERGYVTEILNGCGLQGDIEIRVLIERALISVERNNKLGMHPLLRDMGREIIRERWPVETENRSRLWFDDDVKHILTNNTGTEDTEGLSLKLHSTSTDCFKTRAFKEMKRLRFLQLDNVQLAGEYGYLSKQLRWICWQGFPFKYIPNNFHMKSVIAIDLKHSYLHLVWKKAQILEWLKILDLSHSMYLRETPDFSRLPSLEQLILEDCPSLCKVHPSIGDLGNLQLINLKNCTSLINLPREVYKLKSLTTFVLSGCLKIDILEEDIAQMGSLIILVAENTAVKQIPFSIVSSQSTGYIFPEGFKSKISRFIIQSWMSPTLNPHSSCLYWMKIEDYNWHVHWPLHTGLANLRSILVKCDNKFKLAFLVKSIVVEYGVNFTESRISNQRLRFSLIGVGRCNEFLNTLSTRVSEELASSESCEFSVPGDNHPYWFAHMRKGYSVSFTVPQDCDIKGMILCFVYLSTPVIVATECVTSVLIANYTKCTLHMHNHDTVISLNDEDWRGIISNLGPGDKVEICLTFGHGLVVKNTAVYLIYGESNDMEIEPCRAKGKCSA